MDSSATSESPPAFECLGHPELCQNGTVRVAGLVGRGHGGDTEGEWWGAGIVEGVLRCAILTHNPLLVFAVKLQSLPQQPLSFSPLIWTPSQLLWRRRRGPSLLPLQGY